MAKRCYYEVLELERDATESDVKKAFRRLSLIHHPDRNFGREETARQAFQEVQEANEVLSDPKERRWYDSHRDQILRGGDDDVVDDDSHVVNIWPYCHKSAYNGFGDDATSFYSVYRMVFEQVAAQEKQGGSVSRAGAADEAPSFGCSSSCWSEVSAFYSYWGDFLSRLAFEWKDQYREQDAPNRQIRRAMEKENKKLRAEARKEYQQSIRELVDYIRKRDKRMIARQVEVQRAQSEKLRRAEEANKQLQADISQQKEAWMRRQREHWEKEERERREQESAGQRVEFRLADESDDEVPVRRPREGQRGKVKGMGREARRRREREDEACYACQVCRKTFKSEKQMHNHRQSRAHRKMLEELAAEERDQEKPEDEQDQQQSTQELDSESFGSEDEPKRLVENQAVNGEEDIEDAPADPTSKDVGIAKEKSEDDSERDTSSGEEEDVRRLGRSTNRFVLDDSETDDD